MDESEQSSSSQSNVWSSPEATSGTVLRNPQFRKLWLAQMASTVGDRVKDMALLTLGVLMLGPERAGEASNRAIVAFNIAILLLSPFAGVIVDRVQRRDLMVRLNIIRMLLTLIYIVIAVLQWPLPTVMTVSFLLGSMAALYSPALHSSLPETLHRSDLQRASSFSASTGVLMTLLGIAAGGYIIGHLQSKYGNHISMTVAFTIDAATFALAAWCVSGLVLKAPKPRTGNLRRRLRSVIDDFLQGLRVLLRYRQVRNLMLLCCLFWWVGGGVFGGLMTASDIFGWSVSQVSMLFFSLGMGMVLGGILIKSYATIFRQKVGFPYGFSIWMMILALLYLSRVQNYHAVSLGLIMLGAGSLTLLAPAKATLQQILPSSLRGKIFGVFNTATIGCFIVGQTAIPMWTEHVASQFDISTGLAMQFVILLTACAMSVIAFIVSRKRLRARWDLYWLLVAILRPLFAFVYRLRCPEVKQVPCRGPLIVVANHTSYYDALLLSLSFPRQIRWMITEEYYRAWWGHWLFKRMNCICVAATGDRKAALKAALSCLKEDGVLGLFPEGRLSRDGELQESQPGAAFMALHSGAPVYTAAIEGAFVAFPKGHRLPRLSRISMAYNPQPLQFEKGTDRKAVSDSIMDSIRHLQTQLRSS